MQSPYPDARKQSLQYDGRPDERFGVWVWTWNLGSLSGKVGEVCEELRNMIVGMLFAGGEIEGVGCWG